MAILDKEKEYGNRFMSYVNQIKDDFTVLAFSNVESFFEASREESIEVLLTAEEFLLELCERNCIENETQIVILYEGGNIKQEEYPSIYKFQSVQEILNEIKSVYQPRRKPPVSKPSQKEYQKSVIAVYSASGGSKKTSFSLGLAQMLGAERRCLFLTFDPFCGAFEGGEESEKGMSEFIYYLKQTEENPFQKMKQAKKSKYGFDYYPFPKRPFDLLELEVSDCEYLLQSLRKDSDYDCLVLDIGIWNPAMLSLLVGCDVLYYSMCKGETGERKLREFRRFLQLEGKEAVIEKMITITIPEDERMKRHYEIRDLTEGTMGAFIESVLLE